MNNWHNLYHQQAHLSDAQIQRYVDELCDDKEAFEIERHCLSCDLCNDAVEGLQIMRNRGGNYSAVLLDMEAEIDEGDKGKVVQLKPIHWMLSAATLLILIGLGSFVFLNQTESTTVAEMPHPTEEANEKLNLAKEHKEFTRPETAPVVEEAFGASEPDLNGNNDAIADAELQEEIVTNEVEHEPAKEETIVIKNGAGSVTLKDKKSLEFAEVEQAPAPVVKTEMKSVERKRAAEALDSVEVLEETVIVGYATAAAEDRTEGTSVIAETEENTGESELMRKALALYEGGRYLDALALFKGRMSNPEEKEKGTYYAALCQLELGQTEAARSNFEKVMEMDGEFYRDAKRQLRKLK